MTSSSLLTIPPLELLFTKKITDVKQHVEHESKKQELLYINFILGDNSIFHTPASILREGSKTLTEFLDNLNEKEISTGVVEYTLSSVDSLTFNSILIYLEHFFYNPSIDMNCINFKEKNTVQNNLNHNERPSNISKPLCLQELYNISEWEHHFVIQQLLLFPQNKWELFENGKWIDICATTDVTSSNTLTHHKICNIQHILNVLEAATLLEIPSLINLCGAVISNLLIDLDEKQLLHFMNVTEMFGPDEEKALLREYPWLNI